MYETFFRLALKCEVELTPDGSLNPCIFLGGAEYNIYLVSGILSRIVGGWITDLPCVNRLVFHISLVLCIGVITLLCPVLRSFELLMLYAVLLGLSMGKFICLKT